MRTVYKFADPPVPRKSYFLKVHFHLIPQSTGVENWIGLNIYVAVMTMALYMGRRVVTGGFEMVGSVSSPPCSLPTRLCQPVASRELLKKKSNKTMKKKEHHWTDESEIQLFTTFRSCIQWSSCTVSVAPLCLWQKNKTILNVNHVAGLGISVTSARLFFF